MWTKQFTAEGLTFFYNSSLDHSSWQPPEDGVVHVAPFLGYQLDPLPVYSYESVAPTTQIHKLDSSNDRNRADAITTTTGNEIASVQDDGKKKSIAKRFTSSSSTVGENSVDNSNESSYLRQKAELEAMMGCKKDDSAKWLVR